MDFRMEQQRASDTFRYWSTLYRAIWKRIKQEKAVLDREFQYAMEAKGYPPIDVVEVVARRFEPRGTFRRIDRYVKKAGTGEPEKLTFWVVPREYEFDTKAHEGVIRRKIALHHKRSGIQMGNALVQMVFLASRQLGLTYSPKLTEVRDWNGKKLSEKEGAIDIVLISLKKGKIYGIEAKNVAPIIDKVYLKRKQMKKHISNCEKLDMSPVYLVSRIFSQSAKQLEQAGGLVLETQVQYYDRKHWDLAKELRDQLGYHFVRKVGHHKSMQQLAGKLSVML